MSETRSRSSVGLRVLKGLAIEEYGFVLALQDHVPFQRAGLARRPGDQRCATLARHEREHRVLAIRRVVREVDPRDQLFELAAHEYVDADVRRLRLAAGPGHAAGLDGLEAE